MEALAAFGLACNVFQAIDFGLTAISLCKEVYERGIPDKIQQLKEDILVFKEADKKLKSDRNRMPAQLTDEDKQLRTVATTCIRIVTTLEAELDRFQSKATHSVSRSLKVAVKLIWPNKLDALHKQLSEQRLVLQNLLIRDMRRRQQALEIKQSAGFQSMDTNLQHMIAQIGTNARQISRLVSHEHIETRNLIIDDGNHTRVAVSQEGDRTRAHVDSKIQQLELQKINRAQKEQFVASLRHDEINRRYNDVIEVHKRTFEWVFDETKRHAWDSLPEWLRAGEGMYWVSGKAGSGKSTFMKFLIENPKTRKNLCRWRRSEQAPLVISFFFWISGSSLQRTAKAMLCSLLLQLLTEAEDESIYQILLHRFSRPKHSIHDWSEKDLEWSLRAALGALQRPCCIFLDGLDEFDPERSPDTIISLIRSLLDAGKLKAVISSRPEPSFLQAFQANPKLRLQDLTASDIWRYARNSLMEKMSFDAIDIGNHKSKDSLIDDLVSTLVTHADGVFLWISFAIRSLSQGLTVNDSIQDLRRRVHILPRGMEALYHSMWDRLNEDKMLYRQDAARIFHLILESRYTRLSVFNMMIALNDDIRRRFLEGETFSTTELTPLLKKALSSIRARCAGLLEVSDSSSEEESNNLDSESVLLKKYSKMYIKFIHRSARDFLQDTTAGREILDHCKASRVDILISLNIFHLVDCLCGYKELEICWFEDILTQFRYVSFKDQEEGKRYLEHFSIIEDISSRQKVSYALPHDPAANFISEAAHYGNFQVVLLLLTRTCSSAENSPILLDYLLISATAGLADTSDLDLRFWNHYNELIAWLLHAHDPSLFAHHIYGLAQLPYNFPMVLFLIGSLNNPDFCKKDLPRVLSVVEKLIATVTNWDEIITLEWWNTEEPRLVIPDYLFLEDCSDGTILFQLTLGQLLQIFTKCFSQAHLENYIENRSDKPTWRPLYVVSGNRWFRIQEQRTDVSLSILEQYFDALGSSKDWSEQQKWSSGIELLAKILVEAHGRADIHFKDLSKIYEDHMFHSLCERCVTFSERLQKLEDKEEEEEEEEAKQGEGEANR